MSSPERYDTIVIGAGMSGLAAGIRLALFDRPVVILERHSLWGGLNSFYKLGGRRFDVGLHALTNWAPPREKGVPLTRLLRQLRLHHADLQLREQRFSEIVFPDLRLTFTNDFAHLEQQVGCAFPAERGRFARLVQRIRTHDADDLERPARSTRSVLERELRDPLLREMLLLPAFYYGSAREDDVDWDQFVILFRSIFLEGLARPEGGIKHLLDILIRRYRSLGGTLRMRTGVRRILLEGGAAVGVELDDGTTLAAERVLSCAGYVETMRLCGDETARSRVEESDIGHLSFMESISVLDTLPSDLGHGAATSFFSTRERCRYHVPADLVDTTSGVISAPANFEGSRPPAEGMMRLTVLADHDRWCALSDAEYTRAKERMADASIGVASRYVPDWRSHTVFRDVFTPRTIRRFTGHVNGAVYGSPRKRRTGETGIPGLFLCGTDQGYLGVIGTLLSGITMANRHALAPARTAS